MGNIIRCLTGRDHGHGDDDSYYPYYRAASTASRPCYELQAGGWEDDDEPAAAFWPRQQSLGPIHGGVSVTPAATAASLAQDLQLNMESTSMVNMQPTTPVYLLSVHYITSEFSMWYYEWNGCQLANMHRMHCVILKRERERERERERANLCKIVFSNLGLFWSAS